MKRIVVFGGDGMLGHKMFQTLRTHFADTVCTIRGSVRDERHAHIGLFQGGDVVENVDAMDFATVEKVLSERQPDVVINCIGVIKQRTEARAAIPGITVNALLPHRLAGICSAWGGRLIHFSTDCVFSGQRGHYSEQDPSDAKDLYGQTKFLGEVTEPNALTLRTSIIGRELYHFQSLLEWFLSQEQKAVRGFTRAFYSGVTTNYLANLVARLIEHHPHMTGLYQVTSTTIAKYDLLCRLREAYGLAVEILPDDAYYCDRSMVGDRFEQATGYVCPPWEELVAQLAADDTPYGMWR